MKLSLCTLSDEDLVRYGLGFGLRPVLFITARFDASIVGGVHPLCTRVDGISVIRTQVRIFLIVPIIPGMGVSLVFDHSDFFAQIRFLYERNPQISGASLLYYSSEEIHDRFTLSS